jgi:hypothetical protein
MALKDLVTDLGSFYENNPFAADFKSKAGPTYAQKYGFNQRSLQFGKDRPGDGSSRQPFIKSILPNVTSDPTSATGLLAGITREITSRIDDLERIGRYLITPKGLQFIAKQQLLSAQNPIVPGRPNRASPLKGFYNPLNTLAQVAASGTGLHLEKQGILPIGFQEEQVKYEKIYLSGYSGYKNKLLMLHASKLSPQGAKANAQNTNLEDFGISADFQQLFNYPGGPGISRTVIPFASNRIYTGQEKTQYSLYTQNTFTYNQDQLQAYGGISDLPLNLITTDFRRNIPVTGTQNQKRIGPFGERNTRDYTDLKVNKITRVGIGDPGKKSRDRSSVYNIDFDTVDKVAALPLYTDTNVAELTSHSRDFIRFRFEVLSNENSEATYVHFRAFLGAITDNYGGQWDSTKYVGRGDTFYNYTGFTRDISLSFKVHPQSRSEMKAMYQKLTYLASTLAPDYSGAGGYMKGNITRLTIGSYFYRIPGFITSLTYSVPEDASWEIAFDQPEGGQEQDQMETPRHFDVSVSFTPIHNFAPQLMDGTRAYALFTPDQKFNQPNPYIPGEGASSAIVSGSVKANEAVDSIK